MNHESAEVRRLQNELSSSDVSSGASGSLGGIIDAINKTHSASIQNAIDRHTERSKRLLHRVDVLTNELGAIRNGQDPKTSVPPSFFEVLHKDGKSWSNSEIQITSAGFTWQTVTHSCTELKHVGRDGADRVCGRLPKQRPPYG